MARWSAGRILLLCTVYLAAYLVVSVAWFEHWSHDQLQMRASAHGDYLVGTPIRPWWFALWLLPPALLVVWGLVARRRK